jgi:hypothetical protein
MVEELLEAVALDRDQIRQLHRLFEVGERVTLTGRGRRCHGSLLGVAGAG